MQLNKLPKTTTKRKKRLGRGYGSGKGGHTVGRGQKGQKTRGKIKLWFEGGQTPLTTRLPMHRGKGKFKAKAGPVILNLRYLDLLPDKTQVDLKTLIKYKLVKEKDAQEFGVKILGGGELKKKLTISLPCSKGAAKKIKSAGGEVSAKQSPFVKKTKTTNQKKTQIKKKTDKKKSTIKAE